MDFDLGCTNPNTAYYIVGTLSKFGYSHGMREILDNRWRILGKSTRTNVLCYEIYNKVTKKTPKNLWIYLTQQDHLSKIKVKGYKVTGKFGLLPAVFCSRAKNQGAHFAAHCPVCAIRI